MGLTVTQPDGSDLAVSTSLDDGVLSVAGFTAPEAGEYVFTVSGFQGKKEQVQAAITVTQPPPGSGTVWLP